MGNALSGLGRVREAAKKDKRLQFSALLHHVSGLLLRDSFYALKREAAPGVDGMTWKDYEMDPDRRLEDLHSRLHRGTYRAQPSMRAYIPKADGRQRPLGIAALQDKIVQHAVGTVLRFCPGQTPWELESDLFRTGASLVSLNQLLAEFGFSLPSAPPLTYTFKLIIHKERGCGGRLRGWLWSVGRRHTTEQGTPTRSGGLG
jgi:hypothetical protein